MLSKSKIYYHCSQGSILTIPTGLYDISDGPCFTLQEVIMYVVFLMHHPEQIVSYKTFLLFTKSSFISFIKAFTASAFKVQKTCLVKCWLCLCHCLSVKSIHQIKFTLNVVMPFTNNVSLRSIKLWSSHLL